MKDENRQLKDQLELKHIRNLPDSIPESKPGKTAVYRHKFLGPGFVYSETKNQRKVEVLKGAG